MRFHDPACCPEGPRFSPRCRLALVGLLWLTGGIFLRAASFSINHESAVSYDFAGIRTPEWSGGALVAFAANRTASPVLLSFNDQGQQLQPVSLTIAGSEIIDLSDISRGPDGTLAVCGKAFDHSGRGSGFISMISPATQEATVVRLYPYYPTRITTSYDGTIWTAGLEVVDGKETGPGVDAQRGVLRHYDRAGKLLASLIPRSSLSSAPVAEYGFLRAASGRIGWYTGPIAGPGSQYYEVFSDGTIRKHPMVSLNQYEYVTGLALTDEGKSYITTSDNKNKVGRLLSTGPRTDEWTVETVPNRLSRAALYGGDGARLVFYANSRFKITFVDVSQ